jgi:hypothetical protein
MIGMSGDLSLIGEIIGMSADLSLIGVMIKSVRLTSP